VARVIPPRTICTCADATTAYEPPPRSVKVEAFEAAIARDSIYALAYGLADAYNLGVPFAVLPPNEVIPRAKTAAARARADSTSPK
jgi:hypothetical protein